MGFMLRFRVFSRPLQHVPHWRRYNHINFVSNLHPTVTMVRSNPLQLDDGPLVWIDCEMTGLEPKRDVILEIAVIITDGQLNPVDDGISYVIQTPKTVLDK